MDQKETWALITDALTVPGIHLGLYGPPGTGKSTLATMTAGAEGKVPKVYRLTLTENMELAELRGGTQFLPAENDMGITTQWIDGMCVRAWKESHTFPGVRQVFDEVDRAHEDCESFIHAFCEDPDNPATVMTLPTGEDIKPGQWISVVATMNQSPDILTPALADRFAWFEVNEVNPAAVDALPLHLQQPCIQTCNQPESSGHRLTLRHWFRYSKLLDRDWPLEKAAKVGFGFRWSEILDAIRMSKVNAMPKRNHPGPAANSQFIDIFTGWDDLAARDEVYCSVHGANVPYDHAGIEHKHQSFDSKEEFEAFKDYCEELGYDVSDMHKLCVQFRSRTKSESAIQSILEFM